VRPLRLSEVFEEHVLEKPVRFVPGTELELNFESVGSQKALLEYQRKANSLNYASLGPMKRTFPWNNIVDQTNIVELSDEWLYDIPDFFKNVDNSDINDATYTAVYRYKYQETFKRLDLVKVSLEGAVIDVPRSKAGKKMPPELDQMLTYVPGKDELARLVSKKRLPCKAKKRLYVLFAAQPEANMPYPQTNSETRHMDNFYRRHRSYDKHFSEDTAAEMNRWTTELHLSFNTLDQTLGMKSQESSTAKDSTCQKKGLEGFILLVENVGSSGLKQMAMSMRFEGDFFDRYWTCYLLDCNPEWLRNESHVNSAVRTMLYNKGGEGRIQLDNKKESWRQRRILELLLFQTMVDRMHGCTFEILEDSRSIAKEDDIFWNDYSERSASDYDAFRRNINICQERLREHQQRLQTVEQDMAENFVQIELWLKRERERQTERPRWTFNDEIKYRGIISKLLNQNDHTIQDLRRCQSSLRILIETLNRMLQELERKLERLDKELEKQDRVREANRNADIQRFTYVTVIFLPLGFATGVFSTSGAPSGTTLRNMALTAIGAFVVTGILIACATNLEVVQKSFQECKDVASFQKAKKTWEELKLSKKKPVEQKDGLQITEGETRHSEERSRRSGESSRSSGRELANGESRSVLSERSGQREEVRGSDNIV